MWLINKISCKVKQIFSVLFTVSTIHQDGLKYPRFSLSEILKKIRAKIQINDKVEGNLVKTMLARKIIRRYD